MKKRILASLATIALASTLVGGATFAYFTGSDSNADNTFTAGTVVIDAGAIQQASTSGIDVTNMAPGDVYHGTFQVQNIGSLAAKLTTVTPVTDGNLFSDGNCTVEVDSIPATEMAATDGTVEVPFTVTYNSAATVQGLSGTLHFDVVATQAANN